MVGKNLRELFLPECQRQKHGNLSREVLLETSYNTEELKRYVSDKELQLLTEDQRSFYNPVIKIRPIADAVACSFWMLQEARGKHLF